MAKCIVIADDLTGANATGVLLKKLNYNTATVMNGERIQLENVSDCDCIMFPTDSRGIDNRMAYNRVFNVVQLFQNDEISIYSKRVDSTLRGNLGSETDAFLDVLGKDYIGIAVPCAPASGRITVGGYMLVNGIPLHKTEVALDPKTPIADSRVETFFNKQTKYLVASIFMEDFTKGKEYLAQKIRDMKERGVRIIVFDSITMEDIDLISESVIASGVPFVAIDPGAFTATLAQKLIVPKGQQANKKILTVVGSVNPVARQQMEHLWLSQPVYNTYVNTKALLEGDQSRENEIQRVVDDILSHDDDHEILSVTGDGIQPEYRINFEPYAKKLGCSIDDVSELLNTAFAEIAYRILKADSTFQGLYISGGDITAAVCKRVGTAGLNLMDEVIPLAACGSFMKGEFPGMLIVTKGGMTGDIDAINRCIERLKGFLNM